MLKVGVLGAGHLGKIHLKLLQQSGLYELIGFFDPDTEVADRVSREFGYRAFPSPEALLEQVEVVDIVTPTVSHFESAQAAILSGKHVFIEKPITETPRQAKMLIELADKHKVKGQVGHVEQFNPALLSVRDDIVDPVFIEAHRLAQFNPRGTDVPVVLDLMIHDIEVVLSIVGSPVKKIYSNGASILSRSPDIANARIEFENGCVANLTASRISMKNMRKMRLFQRDSYISVDFYEKKSEIIRIQDITGSSDDFAMTFPNAEGVRRQIYFEYPTVLQNNAILEELEFFAKAITSGGTPRVTMEQGMQALEVARRIIDNFTA